MFQSVYDLLDQANNQTMNVVQSQLTNVAHCEVHIRMPSLKMFCQSLVQNVDDVINRYSDLYGHG